LINFFLDIINFIKLKTQKKSTVGFFCENRNIYQYLKPYIYNKSVNKKIILISFEKIEIESKNIIQFVFLTDLFREITFLTLRLKYLYSSTPGLDQNIFKRSKLYKTKYIYLQHSMCSMNMIYLKDTFNNFNAIQVVTDYQYKELIELKEKKNLNFKIFKSNYLFLKEKLKFFKKNPKIDVLIAPTWNTNFYKYNLHKKLAFILKKKNISFHFRPHTMSVKKKEFSPDEFKELKIKINNQFNLDFYNYKILISDWSGLIFEFYVLNKDVLLINTDKKILNKEYILFKNQPAEIRFRKKIFKNFLPINVNDLIDEVQNLLSIKEKDLNKIDKFYFEM